MYKKILKLNNIMVEIGLHWTHELELAPDHKDVELEFVLKWQEEELNSLQFHSVKTNRINILNLTKILLWLSTVQTNQIRFLTRVK